MRWWATECFLGLKKSNKWFIKKIGTKLDLMQIMKKKYYRHVLRAERVSLEKDISKGCVPRKRKRG